MKSVSIAQFLSVTLGASNDDFRSSASRLLAQRDPEIVHGLRVSIRKIRSILKIARSVYGRRRADATRAWFTRLHQASGPLRDTDVLVETLSSHVEEHPALRGVLRALSAQTTSLRSALRALVRQGAAEDASAALDQLRESHVRTKRNVACEVFASRALAACETYVWECSTVTGDDSEALHTLRIAYKQLRYTAELFAPFVGEFARDQADEATAFQKRLGSLHDLDVALAFVATTRLLRTEMRRAVIRSLEAERAHMLEKFFTLGIRTGRYVVHPSHRE